MPTTFYDMALRAPSESWRAIRTLRAEPGPPVAVVLRRSDVRQREFHMALDQAQQQFAAAAAIGYESRPLNLFYGLTQAGRALAAANPGFRDDTAQWQAHGHGLKFGTDFAPARIFEHPIRQEAARPRSMFKVTSRTIGSPDTFGEAPFGAVVNQLLDFVYQFPDEQAYPRPIVNMFVPATPLPVQAEIELPGIPPVQRLQVDEVTALLAPYPALSGARYADVHDGFVTLRNGRVHIEVTSDKQVVSAGEHRVLRGAQTYRGHALLLPTLGQAPEPLHPLMAWWLALFSLSMAARYAPSTWMQTLSLSQSPTSSRIEFLLDAAVGAVPDLLCFELNALNSL